MQGMEVTPSQRRHRYVDRHVPRQQNFAGGDLSNGLSTLRTSSTTTEMRMMLHTHFTNIDFHNSSSLQNAYNALHAPPSLTSVAASRYSRTDISSSSGSQVNMPQLRLILILASYAFPRGLMPRGCGGTPIGMSTSNSSFSIATSFTRVVALRLFATGFRSDL